MPGDRGAFREGHRLADLLAASGVPASTYHYNKAKGAEGADKAGALGGRRRGVLAHRQRLRPQAIAMCLRAEKEASVANKTVLKIARDGHKLRHKARDRLPQVQLLQGRRRRDLREPARPRLLGRRAVGKLGTDVTEVQAEGGQGLTWPRDFRCLVDIGASEPDGRRRCSRCCRLPKVPEGDFGTPSLPSRTSGLDAAGGDARDAASQGAGVGAHPIMQSGAGSTSIKLLQSMSRRELHRQRGDRAGVRPTSRTSSSESGVPGLRDV